MTLPEFGDSLPEIALRTAAIYAFLVIILRVAGKREVGQLSIFELIVLLLVADAVQNSMVGDNTSIYAGFVAVVTLIAIDRGLRAVTDRSRWLKHVVEGEPRVLVRDGQVFRRAMSDEGIDMEELRAALREHGVRRPSDVRLAVLETDGTISVVPREDIEPPGVAARFR